MMVLDTNVVSELMRPAPSPVVVAWLDAQHADDVYLTSVISAELLFGAARLAAGARKSQLQALLTTLFENDFAGKILPFDWPASQRYASLCAASERVGKTIAMADAQIAATCLAHQAVLVTRNTKDFENTGLKLINPWSLA